MGGVGKTELSLQYALSNQQNYPGGICWIEAREQSISSQIVIFAKAHLSLELPEKIEKPLEQVNWCWQNWPQGNTLIIFNDVTSYARIKPYLPPAGTGFHILLTTRIRLLKDSERLELKVLQPEDAFSLLELLVSKERVQAEADVAQQICQWLGYLPLGLELVSRYLIRKLDLTLTQMLARLNEKRLQQRALKKSEIESDMTAELGVAAAFELSWNELGSLAQEIGYLFSIFDVVPISWSIVEQYFQKTDLEELEGARDEELLGLHLLQREDNRVYRLHELVREFFQAKLAASSEYTLQRSATTRIAQIAKQDPFEIMKILNQKLLDWQWSNDLLQPPALEIGEFLKIAQQAWAEGVGPLSQIILDHRLDGSFPTIGISFYQRYDEQANALFTYAHIGKNFSSSELDSVVECPLDGEILWNRDHESHDEIINALFDAGWETFGGSLFYQRASWPWKQIIEPSLERLSLHINERRLPVDSGCLSFEAAWHAACALTRDNYLQHSFHYVFVPIALQEIETKLAELNDRRFSSMMQYCFNQLRLEVKHARQQGKTHLEQPKAFREFKTNSVTSPEILLAYTSYVFEEAFIGYQKLIERWFPNLASSFRLSSYLPTRLIGTVIPPAQENEVKVEYYWEPLPNGQKSCVDFKLASQLSSGNSSRCKAVFSQQEFLRPGSQMNQQHRACSWYPFSSNWLGNYPVTELTYQWLWEDLAQLKWTKKRFDNAGHPYWR